MGVQYNAPEAVSPPQVAAERQRACLAIGWPTTKVDSMDPTNRRLGLQDRQRRWCPSERQEASARSGEVPRYNVILWDSDAHTYEYVERMLRELFGHTPEECHKMAETVDTQGKVIVLTTTKEHAELKRDQILAYGKDDTDQELQRLDARDDRIGGLTVANFGLRICESAIRHAIAQCRNRMKLRTVTLGCKVNQYETEFVREGLARHRLRGCAPTTSRPSCASSTPAR